MFGYVTPCIQELKVKDYYKFKSYYCGLCKSIKKNYGELPRISLNYDMTFLSIFLDSLDNHNNTFKKSFCYIHPHKKKVILENNPALNYAAFCNVVLFYYKLIDDFNDEKNIKNLSLSILFKPYLKKIPKDFVEVKIFIEENLRQLNEIEKSNKELSLDYVCEPFSKITGFIMSNYFKDSNLKDSIYWFGYNLGKWIYIIDAFDDLEKDMKNNKFNAINYCLNNENLQFEHFYLKIVNRIENILITCAQTCLNSMNNLPINKNKDLLQNILTLGIMEKIDKVFKRSDFKSE